LKRILPLIAGMVTGDRDAYVYLNNTIGAFPDRHALATEISNAGFSDVCARPMTFGIVALHEAKK
jgi:demethylmenaquinone methyltransferase/2-methoxy-6-polyprenyl-1,4-benzoquinol methylase